MGCDFAIRWMWTEKDMVRVLELLKTCSPPIFHICSGVSGIGDVRLDMTYLNTFDHCREEEFKLSNRGLCNVVGDMNNLPFKDSCAGSVVCDPPYKYDFTKPELISELVRICKPRGKIIFIAPWIPSHKNITVLNTDLWKVGSNGAYHKIRTVFYKSNGQIGDYV